MADTNLDSLKLTTGLATASLADGAVTAAKLGAGAVGAAALGANVVVMARSHVMPTIATTGATEVIFRAPCAGTVTAASFVGKDALAQHATAILTFSIVNKGQANAGTTAVLAVVAANSTVTATGSAIVAYTPFALTLHGTPANLTVVKGDVLVFICTSATTLANTITEGLAIIEFTPS